MSLCNVLWEEDKSLPFQFIVVGAGISTFVSPFIAQPFISQGAPSLPRSPHPFPSSDCCPGHPVKPGNHTQPGISVGETGASVSGASSVIWPFVIVGVVTLPAAVAFLYLHFQQPAGRRPTVLIDVSPSSPGDEARTSLLASRPAPKDSRQVLLFRVLIVLLNVPVFGLLLTFADLLTSVGMTPPLCLSAVEASYFNTVLWGAAMIGRAVSAATLVCVPMFLQLLLCCVALVAVGTALVVSGPGNVLGLWLGTAGVALFATPSMPGFIAWSGDHVPLTPAFMNLCLCAAGVGEMLLPFLGGQLMAGWGSEAMLVFALLTMVTMLLLFLMAYYVTTRLPGRRH